MVSRAAKVRAAAAASLLACNTEDEVYARIGVAIDFIYRTSEDVLRKNTRRVLRRSQICKQLRRDSGLAVRVPETTTADTA